MNTVLALAGMEITNINTFLDYYERIRERTLKVVSLIPPGKLEWTPVPGKFTLGDLVRHIGTIERYMYAETVQGHPSSYPGCGRELADGHDNTLTYFNRLHAESMAIFRTLTDADLQRKCTTPGNVPITTWKWLRAMVEHEVHHRGQIYLLLGMLGVTTPPLFGRTSEEVLAVSLPAGRQS
jgi:uncharacterized damage-inducible protein DinB